MSDTQNAFDFLQSLIAQHLFPEKPNILSPALFEKIHRPLLYQFIHKHRLELIVFPLLNQYEKNNIAFKKKYARKIQKHFKMKNCLLALIALFEQNHIVCIALKGIALNTQLYGEQCFRISKDIDLLIQRKDLIKAHHCLINAGFIYQFEISPEKLLAHSAFFLDFEMNFVYKKPEDALEVELHWHLTEVLPIGDTLFAEQQFIQYPLSHNQSVYLLDTEINFLYLCIHAAFHGWQRLQWLVDLAVFFQKITMDWNKVIFFAQKYQAVRPLLEAKFLLQKWNILLPDVPYTWLDKISVTLRLKHANQLQHNPIVTNFQLVFYLLLACPSLKLKWRYLTGLILQWRGCIQQLLVNPHQNKKKLMMKVLFNRFILRKRYR